jgi:hypothetical protein
MSRWMLLVDVRSLYIVYIDDKKERHIRDGEGYTRRVLYCKGGNEAPQKVGLSDGTDRRVQRVVNLLSSTDILLSHIYHSSTGLQKVS